MVATTQQAISWRRLREDPADLETVYFRWLAPDSAAALTDRAGRIFRNHLALAHIRRPGTATTRVYRPDDDSGLGAAIQIVNDDMPMLVDSVSSLLRRCGVVATEVIHPIFAVSRDQRGKLRSVAPGGAGSEDGELAGESWIHVQLPITTENEQLDRIETALSPLLTAVRQVWTDSDDMSGRMLAVAGELDTAAQWSTDSELHECARLLRWLVEGRFTLLGYGYRRFDDGQSLISAVPSAPGLVDTFGILQDRLESQIDIPVGGPDRPALELSNCTLDSVLPGSPDHYVVSIADVQPGGTDVEQTARGEHIFFGALTGKGQHENILDIPVISHRVQQVIEWAGFEPGSFSGLALLEMLQTFPRAELFSSDAHRLFETLSAVMDLGHRRQLRLFLRPERSGIVYCLVYLPRDRYSTDVRLRMSEVLSAEFDAEQIEYSARVSESELAVVYFTVHLRPGAAVPAVSEVRREQLQELLFATTRTWGDRLVSEATTSSEVSSERARAYVEAFPVTYRQEYGASRALDDVRRLERLDAGGIDTNLYRDYGESEGEWRFALYVHGEGISLSRVLPVLHSLGVEVVDERPYQIVLADGTQRWIYDFGLRVPAPLLAACGSDLETDLSPTSTASTVSEASMRHRFSDAVEAMWFGRAEIDDLNELVLRTTMHWRSIAVLRAYAGYLQQAGFVYPVRTIARVLRQNSVLAQSLFELFHAQFDPDCSRDGAEERIREVSDRLHTGIEQVAGLDADRILRALLGLIEATLRTNYFVGGTGKPRECLSFKLDPRGIAELPQPRPRFEIFVHSPRVEGVHLRFGLVARGGLRWSDRQEDFRTEILGLVKAQAVKNAVIVPVGAKGGFVLKRSPDAIGDPAADRRALQAEGIACYRIFISGLLDVTDNVDRSSGQIVSPPRVVRRDGDDAYLVVAADKGTATFSDIANDVARGYGFWLGDAFASGGSVGYDHKTMGITARGAWESVKRHFAEMDVDCQSQDITVVGIGDMSGDVFGNGMLLSRHIRLVAAFDHRHIFLDPNPDAETSFAERERMFALPRSSWADYAPSAISPGGGVFDRTVKSIPISPAVRTALGLESEVDALSPPELIRAILKAPVDLLWNGGIGTYIKAAVETNADAGDKSNDAVRVNANELRVKVIGEGGNLGVTSRGRIEFCLGAGRCNTDALDNSAGVDCSDHEVNIKVLLDDGVASGELSTGERDSLLADMTGEVAELVLRDNISQNFRMGLSRAHAGRMAAVHRRLLGDLEQRRGLDRTLEALPSDAEIRRRAEMGAGLTSPELANLLAHVKISLKDELLSGSLPDDPAFAVVLSEYFPTRLRGRFESILRRHPLRREIVATTVVNRMVDYGGTSYAFRLAEEMGVTAADAVRAFTAATEIFGLHELWHRIRTTPMAMAVRDELELETKRTLDRASRWLLTNRPQPLAIDAAVVRYRERIRDLGALVPPAKSGSITDRMLTASRDAVGRGAPHDLVHEVYTLIARFPLLDIIDVAEIAQRDAAEVAELYYALDEYSEIQRLLDALADLERRDRWQALARLAVRDDLYDSLRSLTLDVLSTTAAEESTVDKIAYWESINHSRLCRVRAALEEIFSTGTLELATLSVAARQVRSMAAGGESSIRAAVIA